MSSRILSYLLALCGLAMIINGCSESPESKAAKEARRQAEKAAAIVRDYKLGTGYDYAAAKEEVDKALSLAAKAGGKADNVYFASAELTTAYASKERQKLSSLQEKAANKLQESIKVLRRLSVTENRTDTIEMLREAGENEGESLKELLTKEKNGVEARLQNYKDRLSALQDKVQKHNEAAEKADKAANEIRQKANKMLREAELLKDEERIQLERQAYALLKGEAEEAKKSVFYYQQKQQDSLDLASSIQVDINTVEPLIPMLQEDIEYLDQRINELENQDQRLDFSSQLSSLQTQYDNHLKQLEEKKEAFEASLNEYRQAVSEQLELFSEAAENYAKVTTQGLKENALLKIAESSKAAATLNEEAANFFKRLEDAAKTAKTIETDSLADSIAEIKQEANQLKESYAQAANEAFDEAFEKYQNVIDRYSSGEFADVAVRSYMTAIYERLNAKAISEDVSELKDELLEKVEQIKDISIQANSDFANSQIASLFTDYGIEFKTEEQKLQEEYQQLKVKFAACKQLSEQEKEDKLLSLLSELNSLASPEDQQFYDNFINDIYDMFSDVWVALYEQDPENTELDIFSEFFAQDIAIEEAETEEDEEVADPNNP